jgi:hypothetical protein
MATKAETAPASVAVKTPPRMPPTMITGMERAHPALRRVFPTRRRENLLSGAGRAMPFFLVMK